MLQIPSGLPFSKKGTEKQRGFSLLEVLVAFAILSVSLGVLLQVFATGLRSTVLADEYSRAALHAESLLEALGRDSHLSEGVTQGRIDDRYSWRSTVSVYVDETLPDDLPVIPYRVTVEVFWDEPEPRFVVLETLRLGSSP